MGTDVSEKRITSGFRLENQPNKKAACWQATRLILDTEYEMMLSFETSVLVRTTLRYIPEDGNFRNYRCENLKFYACTLFLQSCVGTFIAPKKI
jgi:hypothetical protein